MRCPKCGTLDDKVIDSRLSKDGTSIRRRRACLDCERSELRVEKRDSRREPFDRKKLLGSIVKACEKRPIALEDMERVVEEIQHQLETSCEGEVTSRKLGVLVMSGLRKLDAVAYVRYASVYRQFQEVEDFIEDIESLEKRVVDTPDQAGLFET